MSQSKLVILHRPLTFMLGLIFRPFTISAAATSSSVRKPASALLSAQAGDMHAQMSGKRLANVVDAQELAHGVFLFCPLRQLARWPVVDEVENGEPRARILPSVHSSISDCLEPTRGGRTSSTSPSVTLSRSSGGAVSSAIAS